MRVLIVDDHPLVRRGLRSLLLDLEPHAEIIEAGDAKEAVDLLGDRTWQLALVDINLPGRGGLELLRDLKQRLPNLPVLVVSAFTEDEFALRALKLGAAGYISKQAASDLLAGAVRKVLAGGRYVSPAVAEKLAEAMAGGASFTPHETLSLRELQVLQQIARGKSIKEIAGELDLSEKTIATYRQRISGKLGLGSNVELTRYALQHGLTE